MGSKNQEHLWAEKKKKKRKHTIFCDDCRSKISKEKHAQWDPFTSFGALSHLLAESLSLSLSLSVDVCVCTLFMETEAWVVSVSLFIQKNPLIAALPFLFFFFYEIFFFLIGGFFFFFFMNYYRWIGPFTCSHFLLWSVWIEFILLKLKIKNWKYCSKIIFKCVNSIVRPIFNKNITKKWNL